MLTVVKLLDSKLISDVMSKMFVRTMKIIYGSALVSRGFQKKTTS